MEENREEAKKTILIVDDEKPIVDILVYNLQKEGYNTLEANDGEAGIEMAFEKKTRFNFARYNVAKSRWTYSL